MLWDRALDWLKLPPHVLWGLLIAAAAVLWGPAWLITGLGLEPVLQAFRQYLGVVFLLLLAATVPRPGIFAYEFGRSRWDRRQTRKRLRQRLHDLSGPEKAILRRYVDANARTQTLDFADGVTRGLEVEHVLARASTVSQGMTYFDFNIQPWAWNYLREHPDLLVDQNEAVA